MSMVRLTTYCILTAAKIAEAFPSGVVADKDSHVVVSRVFQPPMHIRASFTDCAIDLLEH